MTVATLGQDCCFTVLMTPLGLDLFLNFLSSISKNKDNQERKTMSPEFNNSNPDPAPTPFDASATAANPVNSAPTPEPGSTPTPMGLTGNPRNAVSPMNPLPQKKHTTLILVIILVILALIGAGVGAFALISNMDNKDDRADQTQQTPAVADKTTDTEPDTSDVVDSEISSQAPAQSQSSSTDYIYIGEWGIKIKIPENLKQVSYAFSDFGERTSLSIDGVASNAQYVPDFADILRRSGGLGALGRYHVNEVVEGEVKVGGQVSISAEGFSPGEIVFVDGDYFYTYTSPHSISSETEQDKALELETAEIIKQMLRNNISKF